MRRPVQSALVTDRRNDRVFSGQPSVRSGSVDPWGSNWSWRYLMPARRRNVPADVPGRQRRGGAHAVGGGARERRRRAAQPHRARRRLAAHGGGRARPARPRRPARLSGRPARHGQTLVDAHPYSFEAVGDCVIVSGALRLRREDGGVEAIHRWWVYRVAGGKIAAAGSHGSRVDAVRDARARHARDDEANGR